MFLVTLGSKGAVFRFSTVVKPFDFNPRAEGQGSNPTCGSIFLHFFYRFLFILSYKNTDSMSLVTLGSQGAELFKN